MDFVGLFFEKKENDPLYQQLYSYLVENIRSGQLAAGEKLPGKRSAAAQLGIAVNTVDTAYQMLAAEGYIQARPRSGFVVSKLEQLVPPPALVETSQPQGLSGHGAGVPSGPAGNTFPTSSTMLTKPENSGSPSFRFSFASGDIDTSLFPHKTWARLAKEVLAGGPALFRQGEGLGDDVLREAIAGYLQGFRGVHGSAQQVVVGAGLEVLLTMLACLFPGMVSAMENPGYPKTTQILHNLGMKAEYVPVDEEGMLPDLLEKSGAQTAYLTPSHQFPTGAVMPVGRRTELLYWAAQGKRLIVEDDYDSEFRFDGRPLPCMQGLDKAGRVVYAGTFSRSLAPGLRVAYLVLPPAVLRQWKAAYGGYSCTVSRPEQHTLARFMAEGHFARSLNRMRGMYKKRRELVIAALQAALPKGSYTIENAHTGLYFILRLPGKNAVALAERARTDGIRLRAVDEYRFAKKEVAASPTKDALVLGYGGLADEEVPAGIKALAQSVMPL